MAEDRPGKIHIKKAVFLSAAVIIPAILLYILFIPHDLTRYSSRIESIIEGHISGDLDLGTIVVRVLPSPELKLSNVEATLGGETLFSARRAHLKVTLIPLISGKTVFETFELEDFDLLIRRYETGETNLKRFFEVKEEEKEEEEKKEEEKEEEAKRPSFESVIVRSGRLRFIDALPEEGASFELTAINGSLSDTPKGVSYEAAATLLPSTPVTLYGNGKRGDVKGQGSIRNIMLSQVNPYIRDKSPGASLQGRMDAELVYAYNGKDSLTAELSYKNLEADYPRVFTTPISSQSGSGRVTLTWDKYLSIAADRIKLHADGFDISGSFRLEGPEDKRVVSISASTTPVALPAFKGMLPLKLMPPGAAERVRGIEPVEGSIALTNLLITGMADEFKGGRIFKKPGAVTASAALEGVTFRYKGLKEPFTGISGGLLLKDNTLSVAGLSGRYGKENIENMEGKIRDLTGKGLFNIALSGSFDVNETFSIVRDLSKGPLPERLAKAQATGELTLRAEASGDIKGKTPVKYSGVTNLANGSFRYNGMPAGLESLKAEVAFDNDRVMLKEVSGASGESVFVMSGAVEGYRGKDPHFNLTAGGALSHDTILKLSGKSPEALKVSGKVLFDIEADGWKDAFNSTLSVNATPAGIIYKDLIDKPAGTPVLAEAALSVRGKEVAIRSADLSFGSSSVRGSGLVFTDKSAYRLSLLAEQLKISDLDEITPFFSREYPSSGVITFKIDTMKPGPVAKPSYQGAVSIRDGRFESRYLGSPVEKINAAAEFRGNRASVILDRLSAGQTEANGRLDIENIADRVISFDVNFPRLHAKDLVARKREDEPGEKTAEAKEEEKAPVSPEEPYKPVTGSGKVKAAEGDLWNHPFSGFSTEVLLDQKGVHLKNAQISLDKGRAFMDGSFYTDKKEPLLFKTNLRLQDIDLETMLQAFGTKRRVLSGEGRADITLSANRGVEPFARSLNGEASFYSDRGKLWKFGVLSDIFSIVNIISIDELFREGFPYKGIQGNFYMIDGIISTNDLSLDSDSMRASAIGEIETYNSHIELTLALHPFVTIDKIISNIPLAGWIITGRDESTISLYFEIEGPLKDPEISPLPVKSIKEGIFGILERLIEAPFEFLK